MSKDAQIIRASALTAAAQESGRAASLRAFIDGAVTGHTEVNDPAAAEAMLIKRRKTVKTLALTACEACIFAPGCQAKDKEGDIGNKMVNNPYVRQAVIKEMKKDNPDSCDDILQSLRAPEADDGEPVEPVEIGEQKLTGLEAVRAMSVHLQEERLRLIKE